MSEEIKAPETGAEKQVPYTRFQEVVNSKNEMSARIADLERQVQGLSEKAATVDTLSASVRDWQGKAQEAEGRYSTFQAIAGAGITDPELVEAVTWAYGRLPVEGRPALPDALQAWRSDPSKAPAVLRPHLTTGTPAPAPQTGVQAPTGAPAVPSANAGAAPPRGPAPSPTSAEAIGRMTPAEYRAQRESIMAGLGPRR